MPLPLKDALKKAKKKGKKNPLKAAQRLVAESYRK